MSGVESVEDGEVISFPNDRRRHLKVIKEGNLIIVASDEAEVRFASRYFEAILAVVPRVVKSGGRMCAHFCDGSIRFGIDGSDHGGCVTLFKSENGEEHREIEVDLPALDVISYVAGMSGRV